MTLWAPVVYGRTANSDTWWRAVPEGLDQHGWLGSVIHTAFAGGRELRQRPRFLLAQNTTHRIVGVACPASDLSTTMRSAGSRELSCFVGWAMSRTGQPVPDDTPALRELASSYRDWAAPVYARTLSEVWDAPVTADLPPVTTQPEKLAWPSPVRRVKPGPPPAAGVWAEQAWPAVWDAAQAASVPLTCVIGWQHINSARFEDATHIGVADAPRRPLPSVDYEEPSAPLEPEQSPEREQSPEPEPRSLEPVPFSEPEPISEPFPEPEPEPARRVVPSIPVAFVSSDEPPASDPTPAIGRGPGHAAGHGQGRANRRRPATSGPTLAKLGAAAALGAAVTGVIVLATSESAPPAPRASSSSSPASRAPSPSPTGASPAAGAPVLLQVVISASGQPTAGSLVQYKNGMLSPGQSAQSMSRSPSGPAADQAACASAVATAPTVAPVRARPGLSLCVELKGKPARYGFIYVTMVKKDTVTASATIWP